MSGYELGWRGAEVAGVVSPVLASKVRVPRRRQEAVARAALQLAGLSLQDRDDPSAVVAKFAGDDRFVVDYLAEEVLARLDG